MTFFTVSYDVPASVSRKQANPSTTMKRFGIRFNYSCWIVPGRNVPLVPLKEWKECGIKVRLFRFDADEKDSILQAAKEELHGEAVRIRTAVEKTLKGIEKRYAKAVEERHEDAYKKAYLYHYINLKRFKGALVAAQECAMAFDLTADMKDLFDAVKKTIGAADIAAYTEQCKAQKAVGK